MSKKTKIYSENGAKLTQARIISSIVKGAKIAFSQTTFRMAASIDTGKVQLSR